MSQLLFYGHADKINTTGNKSVSNPENFNHMTETETPVDPQGVD